jgi:hypothetical protein
MAKMKLKQLRDADVRYISLVDRAATRIPFRVLKRDKESKMGIDLTKVFKSDDTGKPYVSALVVFAQKDEAVGTQVQDAIKAQGFTTDRVQKSDAGETLVFSQSDQKGDTQIVRLSDHLLVNVGGLRMPGGWVGEMIEEHGFFPDLNMAAEALRDQTLIVAKSDTPQADATAMLGSYAAYLDQMAVLPTACYKLDEVITEIIQKCSCEDKKEETEKGELRTGNPAAEAIKEETEYDKKKRAKGHPPAEMAPKDEEDDQKPPPPEEEARKSDDAILTALSGLKDTLAGLSQKLETVVTEQGEQKKVLDEVVQKTDTFSKTLKETVTAPPVSEDRPSSTRMRIQKADDDPRTGNFDTAFLRKRR